MVVHKALSILARNLKDKSIKNNYNFKTMRNGYTIYRDAICDINNIRWGEEM